MKQMEADLIIVAGGPAGLAAAVTAGENNLKTILFEKSNTCGGAANMGMGPLGINTDVQKKTFNRISFEEAFQKHMEYTHWRVDADLVSTYFKKSAETIKWLEEMGVKFAGAFRYFEESAATWHIVMPESGEPGPRCAGTMNKIMQNKAKELGVQFEMETSVTDLICEKDEDGYNTVVGVKAKDASGEEIEARAKAVIVATGGFGNNYDMIAEEFDLHLAEDFFPFMIPGITGDGLKMMWKAGAMKYGANIEAIFQLPNNLDWFILDTALRQPNLFINQMGERFMDEGVIGNTTYAGNAIKEQPGHYAYLIMDRGILNDYRKNGPDLVDLVHPQNAVDICDEQIELAKQQNYEGFIWADTMEELAEKLDIDLDTLKYTIDEYNSFCDNKQDLQFNKNPKFLHKVTGKGGYLVGKFYLASYGTVGGVKINKYCEVLDEEFYPIPGLYSAGSDANTIYGDSYNFTIPGNTMGFAVNTGRMAAEAAADYIKGE
ncbi:MAG: FAD-binding protein [Lachnospiraceae bacterium]|nr:FAD-binding protein [Lachnospiraceae bacterium]